MEPGVWGIFVLIVFLLGIFFQVYVLAAFAVVLGLLGWIARLWQKRSLQGLTYHRVPYYRRGFPGERLDLQAEVENRKFLPLSWFRVIDPWPYAIGPEQDGILINTENPERGLLVNLFSLRWYERARRSYRLLLRRRGIYALGPARLESGDLFGLFEQVDSEGPVDYLTVFPRLFPFELLNLPSEDPFGDRRSRRRLYEDPTQPMGIRDYQPEDDFRRIHWPATARTGELQVKVYQPVNARVLVVCLNVSTLQYAWQGTRPDLLEHLVSVSATLVSRGLEDGYRVGLISNGSLARSDQAFRVPPGRSPNQLATLLSTLAAVTPFVTTSFDRYLTSEMTNLPYGATLVIVTAIHPPELIESILRLKTHGHRITLLSFDRQPPQPVPGIQIVHSAFTG